MRNRPCLTADDVAKMMAAAKAEAVKNNWIVSIAIVDDAGYLLQFERLEGAGPTTADVAIGKARAAALTRRPTKFFEERVVERPVFLNYPYPNSILIQGGLPIIHQNEGLGAVGVSGRASHEDEHLCQKALDALGA